MLCHRKESKEKVTLAEIKLKIDLYCTIFAEGCETTHKASAASAR